VPKHLLVLVRLPREASDAQNELELLAVVGRSKVDREQFLIDVADLRVATLAVCPQPPVCQPLAERVPDFRHVG
jgi:hypothetical protein